MLSLCITPINFLMTEPVIMKLSMYIMAPEPISAAHYKNLSHQSSGYLYASLLGDGSVKTLLRQRIHTQ
jgi:hypothetical protein